VQVAYYSGRRFRVLDVVSFEEADELGFVGMLKVEAAQPD
jgi:hypothetical protein